jgi:hypothetical protein
MDSKPNEAWKYAIGAVIIGGVAGMVVGARCVLISSLRIVQFARSRVLRICSFMRDFKGIANEATRVYKAGHMLKPARTSSATATAQHLHPTAPSLPLKPVAMAATASETHGGAAASGSPESRPSSASTSNADPAHHQANGRQASLSSGPGSAFTILGAAEGVEAMEPSPMTRVRRAAQRVEGKAEDELRIAERERSEVSDDGFHSPLSEAPSRPSSASAHLK